MLEEWLAGLIGAFAGFVGFYFGQRLNPKNRQLAETVRFYEEANEGLRKEVRRAKGLAAAMRSGNVPAALGDASTAEALVEGIFEAMPPNIKGIAAAFKPAAIKWVQENPDEVEALKGMVMSKIQAKRGEEQIAADIL